MFNTKWVILKTLVVMVSVASWLTLGAWLSISILAASQGPILVCGSIG